MPEPKDVVKTESFKGYTNTSCEFFPCHKGVKPEEFNCLFCYCPLVFLECPGPYKEFSDKHGNLRKDCSECSLPHNGIKKSWNFIQHWLENPKPWKQVPKSAPHVPAINLYTYHDSLHMIVGGRPEID